MSHPNKLMGLRIQHKISQRLYMMALSLILLPLIYRLALPPGALRIVCYPYHQPHPQLTITATVRRIPVELAHQVITIIPTGQSQPTILSIKVRKRIDWVMGHQKITVLIHHPRRIGAK
jgi:hypothetical protein